MAGRSRDSWTDQSKEQGDVIELTFNKRPERNLVLRSLEDNLARMLDRCLPDVGKTPHVTPTISSDDLEN